MILTIISLLAGVVLGLRFKVLVLVPAMACALLVAISVGIAHANTPWLTAWMAFVALASLQIGYLAGSAIRFALGAARMGSLRIASLSGSLRARPGTH